MLAGLLGLGGAPLPRHTRRLQAAASAMAPALAAQPVEAGPARPVQQVVQGRKLMEGAGVRICRTVGTPALRNLDPFLMLGAPRPGACAPARRAVDRQPADQGGRADELRMPASEATAGFPNHPHRGFETCSIMIQGLHAAQGLLRQRWRHHGRRCAGAPDRHVCCCAVRTHALCCWASCALEPCTALPAGCAAPAGCADSPLCWQWMTAGRGIIHSEMPVVTTGDLWGFQLWINLPAKDKLTKPQCARAHACAVSQACAPRAASGLHLCQGAPAAAALVHPVSRSDLCLPVLGAC